MGQNKLERFAQLASFENVYQNLDFAQPRLKNHAGDIVDLRGKWQPEHFKNPNPLILELACGKGDYALALAENFPTNNYIGVDIKGNRIWVGAKEALEKKQQNVCFLRTQIEYLTHFFAPQEVQEIWITFADPQLGKPKKRLTSPRFLDIYRKILAPNHIMHLKTDSPELYESTLEVIAEQKLNILYQNEDIYAAPLDFPELEYKTFYEKMHLENGKSIKYLRWTL
jgi:tRNA (guanine-N7-)-methyltransferase